MSIIFCWINNDFFEIKNEIVISFFLWLSYIIADVISIWKQIPKQWDPVSWKRARSTTQKQQLCDVNEITNLL